MPSKIQNKKVALITGVTGQDGSYMADLLLSKGYEVHGLIRRSSVYNKERIAHLNKERVDHAGRRNKVRLHFGDLADWGSLYKVIADVKPDEIYNFAAQSFVEASFILNEYTMNVTGLSALRMLEIIRHLKKPVRFYQASSSEMFGNAPPPQCESTPFYPASPYGIAKVAAFHSVQNHREAYGTFAVNGILFNHESPRRGEEFLTRKISLGVARVKAGLDKDITLGNLEAKRDWGYAPEYVEAAWRMIQHDKPEDFVIATGETHSVKEFVEEAFNYAGLDWRRHVKIRPAQFRPRDVDVLIGDASKAKKILGWQPKTSFKELVKILVDADCASLGVKA
ncbi:GDP-mannose 4,6-dehydratase [Candidatus Giovannonibacteria bacterium]|nr:GDP-mannose 4,6-dehydratase [Candidatus Giovannonibacteria bacterium]